MTTMQTKQKRPLLTALVALTVAGLLGACSGGGGGDDDAANGKGNDDGVASLADDGGSGSGDGDQASAGDDDDGEQELLDWVECMRGEGIDLPDPTRDADGNLVLNGNGINIGGSPNGTTRNDSSDADDGEAPPIDPEEMDAATETCGPPPAVGGEISDEDIQAQQDAALQFAECMRDEGIEDFPDPDFSDMGPGSGPQTHSESAGEGSGPVVAGPFGTIDLDDPEMAAAFEKCQDLIGPPPGEDGPS
jgi:hypothetical protein